MSTSDHVTPRHGSLAPPREAPVVLVVDDALCVRELLRTVFEAEGYVVEEAANGNEAISRFLTVRPTLTMLDLVLPGKHGLEVLRAIRAADAGARVIVLSAIAKRERVLEALKAGAEDFIPKPAPLTQLIGAVERALGPPGTARSSAHPTAPLPGTSLAA